MAKKYYITAAIPYVNAAPHIGHALEFVQTDAIKRFKRLQGFEAVSLSGGDENALKNVQAAEEAGIPVQEFVDENTEKFKHLAALLSAGFDFWQKGSDKKKHHLSSQKLWKLCQEDIYKKRYTGLYCVGCEAFYTLGELVNGECVEHPGKKLQEISEENYFFKLSKYEKVLKQLIESDKLKISPEGRKKEVLSFIKKGLTDISISRSNERAKNWGVPVPEDPTQRQYVWFDALNIYQTGVGFGWDDMLYKKYWPADLHVIGKGIIRFHAVYWPAILLSAKLEIPRGIFVHDYFTVNGQKMSKTLGNVIDPSGLILKYGTDPLRYYFLAKFNPFTDGDFSQDKFKKIYNSDLANGLGNLVARVGKLCERSGSSFEKTRAGLYSQAEKYLETYRFDKALKFIWEKIAEVDKKINSDEPWSLQGEALKEKLENYIFDIRNIAFNLLPFLPKTAQKIEAQFKGPRIKSENPLFPRI